MEFYYAPPSLTTIKKFSIYALFVTNIAVIFALWWMNSAYYIHNPEGGNILIALGRIAGLLAEYFLLVQLMLVGRVKWIEHLFGFDRLNAVHRFIGYSIPALLLSHVILLIMGNATANRVSFISQLADFLANKEDMLYAYFAFLLFLFVIFISIVIVRKKLRYETWYFVHVMVYLGIVFALQHQLGTGDLRSGWALSYWYALNFTVFGFVLLYRFVRPLYLFAKHRFVVQNIVQETPDTYSLYISGKNIDQFFFQAGQYANITLLNRRMWYTHPFSFSAAYNGKFIRFTIKSLGDYTNKIRDVIPGTRIIIDGPLGLFVEKRAVRDKFLFIAGGIGITPLRAMIESLAAQKKDIVLMCGSRTEKDIAFKKEFEDICKLSPSIIVHNILGTPTPGYESGYVDKEKIVRLVPDFYTREVFLCGPPPMMKATVSNLNGLGFSADYIHFERFSF
jgi:predicted ferric reductase